MALETLRSAVIAAMTATDASASPVRGMTLVRLETWPADWFANHVDPGGYLAAYGQLPAVSRTRDLLLEDALDASWLSEYTTASRPVAFRCSYVLHLANLGPDATEVTVFEDTPEVNAGLHWALAHEGIGFAKVDDIRFVEPTVTDRQKVAAWLESFSHR